MLAAVFVGPGKPLELGEFPDPVPGDGEVLLKIERCGICATDLHLTEPSFAMPAGFVAGHERGTIVTAVGRGVERLKVGDHVVPHSSKGCGRCDKCLAGTPFLCAQVAMNMGGFAQFMVCPEAACLTMPSSMPFADSALVEPLAVGLLGVERNPFPIGARIAVLGVGPVVRQTPYATLGGRIIGYTFADSGMRLGIYGRNLTNKAYINSTLLSGLGVTAS